MSDKNISFEKAIERIEEIVSILENGNSTLDDSLKLFEEATKLCEYCNNRLEDAGKKIKSVIPVNVNSDEEENDE